MPTPDLITRRATFAPSSVDIEARTARLTFSTGAAMQRRDFEGPYIEVLDIGKGAIDLSRLTGGPVLNGHRQGGVENVIGVVTGAETDGRAATASIKFSSRPEIEPILRDVADGVIRNVSVGYTVETWRDSTDPKTGQRTRTATRWTPVEISLVAVSGDPSATIRSEEMPQTPEQTIETSPNAGGNDAATRAAIDTEIRTIATVAGLDTAFADDLITRQASPDEARRAAFDALAQRGGPELQTQAPRIVAGADFTDPQVRAAQIGEALYTRVNPGHEPSEPARQFIGLTLPEIGREILRAHGLSVTGLSPATVVTRALHSTSDFSLILADTVGRTLRAAYQAAPAGVRGLARQTTAADFRTKHRLMLGEAPTLEKVNQHGEFKSGSMAEGEETYKLATYGRIIGISRQAIVNDDLGAFSDLSARLGIAAAEFEAQTLVDLLTSGAGNGPTMADTKTLFHADHGNKAASGGAIAEATLSTARTAMRTQTGLSGKPINVTPRALLVPAVLETTAEKQVAVIQPHAVADVNPFGGRLQIVTDARLDAKSATRWYIAADPAQIDGLEFAFLEGEPGPQIESQQGFRIDGVEIKVRLDFGAGFVDHRSWYMNAGA
ncbi:hypothetical protein LCGC14_2010350 [marine sediment metagenome]|uniref:Bacteriophage Mu GpT domain-containing protein n=1 Tax=marine sediment metagenome TaxID=412755 RepID=A0A0F9FN12_9ZZZZ